MLYFLIWSHHFTSNSKATFRGAQTTQRGTRHVRKAFRDRNHHRSSIGAAGKPCLYLVSRSHDIHESGESWMMMRSFIGCIVKYCRSPLSLCKAAVTVAAPEAESCRCVCEVCSRTIRRLVSAGRNLLSIYLRESRQVVQSAESSMYVEGFRWVHERLPSGRQRGAANSRTDIGSNLGGSNEDPGIPSLELSVNLLTDQGDLTKWVSPSASWTVKNWTPGLSGRTACSQMISRSSCGRSENFAIWTDLMYVQELNMIEITYVNGLWNQIDQMLVVKCGYQIGGGRTLRRGFSIVLQKALSCRGISALFSYFN